jgi:hypothetical protein
MELAINVLITLLQIALFAFLLWGASLCLFGMKEAPTSGQAGFERVASLVLLALLCTTLAGLG